MSAIDRSELDGYEALVSELRANPPVAPERLRERVLEGAPAPRRRRSRRRRLLFVVVPVAVVLAVGAALVHGFVSSGSSSRTPHWRPLAMQSPARGSATAGPVHGHVQTKRRVSGQDHRPEEGFLRGTRRGAPAKTVASADQLETQAASPGR